MKLKLTIGVKIGLGFGVITLAVVINSIMTNSRLNKSIEANDRIKNVYEPSLNGLNKMQELLDNSKMLIRTWVFIDKKEDAADKIRLKELHQKDFPALNDNLLKLSTNWPIEDQNLYKYISTSIKDTLFQKHQLIMSRLNTFESYDDPLTVFEIIPMVGEDGEVMALSDTLSNKLGTLIDKQNQEVETQSANMISLFKQFQNLISTMGILLTIIAVVISVIVIRSMVRPINYIKNILLQMGKGILPSEKIKEGNDEIGQMSVALNQLVSGLKDISDFSLDIGRGNFNKEFTPLSKDDALGNALLHMRDDLRNAALEEEKRKKEDNQRNWATQGVAKFGELLRKNNDNTEKLSYDIISNLVTFMDANQGGIFFINDNDPNNKFIELMACYAYSHQKFIEQTIEIGEGLVGRCVLEGETIFITDVPSDYIKITSGLGDANPNCVLIVPLKVNEEIFGVIELASFKVFEPYQTEFVEKIGESIASTISTVKINMRTQMLLEQSQQQAEEMSAQEEEMRQNMEELRATQEASATREMDLRRKVEELKTQILAKN